MDADRSVPLPPMLENSSDDEPTLIMPKYDEAFPDDCPHNPKILSQFIYLKFSTRMRKIQSSPLWLRVWSLRSSKRTNLVSLVQSSTPVPIIGILGLIVSGSQGKEGQQANVVRGQLTCISIAYYLSVQCVY